MSRVLVVANQTLAGEEFLEAVRARLARGSCEFYLLVPATARAQWEPTIALVPWGLGVFSRTVGGAFDVQDDRANARTRLERGLRELEQLNITVDGEVGDPDPMKAIQQVVARLQCDEIILSTLPSGISRWLGQDLPHRMERTFQLPLTVVTARGAAPKGSPTKAPQGYVRVPGREDIATVLEVGKTFGEDPLVSCHVLLFPATGEVCCYRSDMVLPVAKLGDESSGDAALAARFDSDESSAG